MPMYRTKFLYTNSFEVDYKGKAYLGKDIFEFTVIKETTNKLGFDLYLIDINGLLDREKIYGYTDDVGKDAYNFKLSTKRATAIQDKFIENGIKSKIIVTIEGKGRILIDDDIIENLPEKRSKNRRVDVVLNLKPLPKIEIPGFYNTIQKHHVVGDHIFLDLKGNLLLPRSNKMLSK